MKIMFSDLPALQAEPFEFQKAPSPKFLLAVLKLELPLNSFEPKLQPLDIKRKLEIIKTNKSINLAN